MNGKTILLLVVFTALSVCPVFGSKLNVAAKMENEEILKPLKIILYNNQIYLLDRGTLSVKGYSKDGKLLVSVGKKGQGPGEFVSGNDFEVYDDKIFVLDSSANKVEIFSLKDGKHLKSRKITAMNTSRFSINREGKCFVATLKFMKEQKIISELVIDKEEFKPVNSFLDCIPLKSGNFSEIYNNFGLPVSSKDRVYFAYIIKNEILEFSLKGEPLKRYNIPLESLDLAKLFKNVQGTKLVLKEALNYDIRVDKDNRVYLLSRDGKRNLSIIFILEKGEFKEKYTMSEMIISFDISGAELWAIDSKEMDILKYNLPGK